MKNTIVYLVLIGIIIILISLKGCNDNENLKLKSDIETLQIENDNMKTENRKLDNVIVGTSRLLGITKHKLDSSLLAYSVLNRKAKTHKLLKIDSSINITSDSTAELNAAQIDTINIMEMERLSLREQVRQQETIIKNYKALTTNLNVEIHNDSIMYQKQSILLTEAEKSGIKQYRKGMLTGAVYGLLFGFILGR